MVSNVSLIFRIKLNDTILFVTFWTSDVLTFHSSPSLVTAILAPISLAVKNIIKDEKNDLNHSSPNQPIYSPSFALSYTSVCFGILFFTHSREGEFSRNVIIFRLPHIASHKYKYTYVYIYITVVAIKLRGVEMIPEVQRDSLYVRISKFCFILLRSKL